MKDNFSQQSEAYAKHRPVYPQELFDFILSFIPEKKLAWDCATGNGQTASVLSKFFENVYATDISNKQIENAIAVKNITYAIEPAEHTSIENNAVDLITVSQALHWLEFDKFYHEAKRVSKQQGIIAAWTYNLLRIDPVTDTLIHHHYFEILGKYWDKERSHVNEGYINVPFPFRQIAAPGFFIKVNWNLEHLRGYLNTWSALQQFIALNKYNPVDGLMEEIKQHWPETERRNIEFPITLKLGYLH